MYRISTGKNSAKSSSSGREIICVVYVADGRLPLGLVNRSSIAKVVYRIIAHVDSVGERWSM